MDLARVISHGSRSSAARLAGRRLGPAVLVLAALAAPAPATAATRHSLCYATAVVGSHSVHFGAVRAATGGLVRLSTPRGAKRVTLAQTPTCAAVVAAGGAYRATLRYRSTAGSLELQVLSHSRAGWRLWYDAARLGRTTTGSRQLTVALKSIPRGVDRVSLALTLSGSGSALAGDFAVSPVPVPSTVHVLPASEKPAAAAAEAPAAEAPAGLGPGTWEVLPGFGARSVHAILLQNGRVLIMAGSGNSLEDFTMKIFKSWLYDPATNEVEELKHTPGDVFCSGHVQLANGNVLIVGGTGAYPPPAGPGEEPSTEYKGENASWIFNIRTDEYEPVKAKEVHQPSEPGPLLSGTWYPSATELGNGDVISFGGLNEQGQGATSTNYYSGPGNEGTDGDGAEEWVGFGSSKLQQTYDWFWGLYPSMILTADGRLFYDGSHVFGKGLDAVEKNPEHEKGVLTPAAQAPTGSSIYDFYCTPGKTEAEEHKEQNETNPNAIVTGPNGKFERIQSTPGLREPDHRDQSASLLLPPAQDQKVMIMGGGETYEPKTDAIDLTDEIDLKEKEPHWKAGPNLPRGTLEDGSMEPMGAGKMYDSAVALPDGTLLETGGALIPRTENVHEASIFNPKTNTFTPVAADPVGRDYHSEALLLPDGRVMALGSNPLDGRPRSRSTAPPTCRRARGRRSN